jgi:hypothetical protein
MEYSTLGKEQEISAEGVVYDRGSIYGRLQGLTDMRKARGKRYSLVTLLMIVLLAKLSGADSPTAIAEWGSHRHEELKVLLRITPKRMPERSTYRRLLAYKMYEAEIERLVGEYNQSGKRGKICALDGKALLGMLKREDGTSEYALSVYDVEAGKTVSQVEVGNKENEITKAPEAIKMAKIAGKVVTGDALHTQKRNAQTILDEQGDYVFPVKENQSNLYKNIQSLFAPEYPKPGFGKIQTDFLQAQTVNKGHGRIEKRTLTTSEMLNAYAAWRRSIVWSASSSGGGEAYVTKLRMKSNLELPVCRARKPRHKNSCKFVARIGASKLVRITVAMSHSMKMPRALPLAMVPESWRISTT